MIIRSIAVIAVLLFVASCATTPAPSPLAIQKLAASGVAPSTQKRIQAGRVLGFDDIKGLCKAGVPDSAIVSYLKSTHAPYKFSDAQLGQLSDAGAGSLLVNYLGKSVGYFEATQRSQTGGSKWQNHPYFNDPDYWGAAPFPYAFPDEWEDPALVGMWY